ncbi:MAG: hypothetical protein FJ299_15745 [Planctomycetes bacterium]|nr:hypothetical protein [Planctomycetota bacterium]
MIELPPGPVREAWERGAALPAQVPAPPVAPAPPGGPWQRWARLVQERRHGELAMLAGSQQRWEDLWRHWLASAAERDGLGLLQARQRLVPLLVGSELELADGALLRPALPPQPPGPEGSYQRCRYALRGLRVGAAVLDLELALELDGVQIDLMHVAGDACRLALVMPTMPQFRLAQVYCDWEERTETPETPIPLEIRPGDERHTLWARFEYRPNPWPSRAPSQLPAAIAARGIAVLCGADDPRRAELEEFAAALAQLTGARVEVRALTGLDATAAEPAALANDTGLTIDLRAAETAPSARDLKWLALVSLAERWSLASAPR